MKKTIVNINALDRYIIYPGNYIKLNYPRDYFVDFLIYVCVSGYEGLCSLISLSSYNRLNDNLVRKDYFKCIDGRRRLGYNLKEVLRNIEYESIHILSYGGEEALENEIEL